MWKEGSNRKEKKKRKKRSNLEKSSFPPELLRLMPVQGFTMPMHRPPTHPDMAMHNSTAVSPLASPNVIYNLASESART